MQIRKGVKSYGLMTSPIPFLLANRLRRGNEIYVLFTNFGVDYIKNKMKRVLSNVVSSWAQTIDPNKRHGPVMFGVIKI